MKLLSPILSSLFLFAAVTSQVTSSPLVQRQANATETGVAARTSSVSSISVDSTLGTPEPLTSEVGYSVASDDYTYGPPTSRTSNALPFGYPGLAQATAYYSAASLASKLGNITASFAEPTALTLVNVASTYAGLTALESHFVCPSGMVGISGKCCPGVIVGSECLRTDTASLPSYAAYTGRILDEGDFPGQSGASFSLIGLNLTFLWISTLLVSILAALGTFV